MALSLERSGHHVAVIDQEESSFGRLGATFEGERVLGVGFDRDTLKAARVSEAYAFAAVSSGDNSNILAARVARETFGVERVAARIYDPRRAMVYQRLGIPTVATVRWTADQIISRLVPHGAIPEFTDPSGKVVIAEVPYAVSWVATPIADVESLAATRVAFLTRLGDALIPGPDTVLQDGDLLHVAHSRQDLPRLERVLSSPRPHD